MKPGDFPLGSPESRAAARMQLTHLLDSRKWISVSLESEDGKFHFKPWSELSDGSMFRSCRVPFVWATLPIKVVPVCRECGEPLAEQGRYGILVCFSANCLDRHDPAPPPKNRPRRDTGSIFTEAWKQKARDMSVMERTFDLEEGLARRLNIHPSFLDGIISGRDEADASLLSRIGCCLEGEEFRSHEEPA